MKVKANDDKKTPADKQKPEINITFLHPNFLHNGRQKNIPVPLNRPNANWTKGITVIFMLGSFR